MKTYSHETHSMYLAQRQRGYRNSLIAGGVAVAGMLFALYSTIASRAPEAPSEPTAVESIDNKVSGEMPSGLAAGIAVSALGIAAATKYALDGVKADQKQFAYPFECNNP